jgi:hypothetical protein
MRFPKGSSTYNRRAPGRSSSQRQGRVCFFELRDEIVKPIHPQGWVRLASWSEVLLHPEMYLNSPRSEPPATAGCERLWLREDTEAEHVAVEGLCLALAIGRHGKLHVVEGCDADAHGMHPPTARPSQLGDMWSAPRWLSPQAEPPTGQRRTRPRRTCARAAEGTLNGNAAGQGGCAAGGVPQDPPGADSRKGAPTGTGSDAATPRRAGHRLLAQRNRWRWPRRPSGQHRAIVFGSMPHHFPIQVMSVEQTGMDRNVPSRERHQEHRTHAHERPTRCRDSTPRDHFGRGPVEISLISAVRTHALCMHTQD